MLRFAPPSLQPPILYAGMLWERRFPAQTREDDIIRDRKVIQDLELFQGEPSWDEDDACGYHQNDEHGEPNRRNRLRDGHAGEYKCELESDP